MGRVTGKDGWVCLPLGTDEFVRREAAQGLEPFGVMVVQQKGLQVLVAFLRRLVVETLDGRFFNRAVRALDRAVRPRVGRLGQAVFHAVCPTDAVKTVPAGQQRMRLRRERRPVVGQDGMHFTGHLVEDAAQKLRRHPLGPRVPCDEGYLAGAVDGRKQVPAAFRGPDLGKIDVEVADGVVLEFLFRRSLPVFAQRQSADAVPPKAAVQGRARAAEW